MEAALEEDAPSYSMVKKWTGEFKRGRDSLKYDHHDPGRPHNARFCPFSLSRSKRLETTNWLWLIICIRKKNGYSFKLAVYSLID